MKIRTRIKRLAEHAGIDRPQPPILSHESRKRAEELAAAFDDPATPADDPRIIAVRTAAQAMRQRAALQSHSKAGTP